MRVPAGYIDQAELDAQVQRAKTRLGPEVVRVTYSVGPDHDDDPSIYFRITLTDEASREDRLREVMRGVTQTFLEELMPYENWGADSVLQCPQ